MTALTDITPLLIEDDPTDAAFVKRHLLEHRRDPACNTHGIEIRDINHVTCLADAINRLTADTFDLVLLDLGLPDSDGLETVAAVVERTPTVPVIVLTGQKGLGVEAIQHGAHEYLVKSQITGALLFRTIRYAIERARTIQDLRDRNARLALVNEILRTDLRNEVSLIFGLGDSLRDRVAHDERTTIEAMLEASDRTLDLLDATAEVINVLSEERLAHPQPCDLRSLLAPVLDRYRDDPDVSLSVEYQLEHDSPVSVLGNPMLTSVFESLVTDAIARTDGDQTTVDVRVSETPNHVTVSFVDDGVRIPSTQKRYLTHPSECNSGQPRIGTDRYLVATVLERIDADLSVEEIESRETVVTIRFDRPNG